MHPAWHWAICAPLAVALWELGGFVLEATRGGET